MISELSPSMREKRKEPRRAESTTSAPMESCEQSSTKNAKVIRTHFELRELESSVNIMNSEMRGAQKIM